MIVVGPTGPDDEWGAAVVDFTLCIDPVGDELAAARECEAAVFLETYGNTADQWAQEYGPYDDDSVFLAVLDRHGEAVGTARMILPGQRTIKSLADVSRAPWEVDGPRAARAAGLDLERTWDVGTLAVRRGMGRSGLVAAALYHGMIQTLRANGAGWVVMIIDRRARRLLDMSGIHTTVLPGTAPGAYLGSTASVPVWSEVSSSMDRQRAFNPEAYRLITQGIGLDGIEVPGATGFALRSRRTPARPALKIAL